MGGVGALFVFVNLEIRHLWLGGVLDITTPVRNGELYTYSVVWLVIAMGGVLLGNWRSSRDIYLGGMALLVAVIGKVFALDLAGLEGLLRVASFMGLGLCLLGLSYVHALLQRQGTSDN